MRLDTTPVARTSNTETTESTNSPTSIDTPAPDGGFFRIESWKTLLLIPPKEVGSLNRPQQPFTHHYYLACRIGSSRLASPAALIVLAYRKLGPEDLRVLPEVVKTALSTRDKVEIVFAHPLADEDR